MAVGRTVKVGVDRWLTLLHRSTVFLAADFYSSAPIMKQRPQTCLIDINIDPNQMVVAGMV